MCVYRFQLLFWLRFGYDLVSDWLLSGYCVVIESNKYAKPYSGFLGGYLDGYFGGYLAVSVVIANLPNANDAKQK